MTGLVKREAGAKAAVGIISGVLVFWATDHRGSCYGAEVLDKDALTRNEQTSGVTTWQ